MDNFLCIIGTILICYSVATLLRLADLEAHIRMRSIYQYRPFSLFLLLVVRIMQRNVKGFFR